MVLNMVVVLWNRKLAGVSTGNSSMLLKMAAALKLALITFIIFTAGNSVCYSFHGKEVQDVPDMRIISSLWIYKSEKGICLSHTRALSVLLILAGVVELCPGPKFFVCAKIIRKNQRSTDCCNCDKALHLKCAFDKMVSDQDKFYCLQCVHDQEQSLNDGSSSNACNIILGKLSDFLNTKELALFHQNMNGLLGKLDNLRLMLHETKRKIDILVLTKTWRDCDRWLYVYT